jgi:hypothetical protein
MKSRCRAAAFYDLPPLDLARIFVHFILSFISDFCLITNIPLVRLRRTDINYAGDMTCYIFPAFTLLRLCVSSWS